MKKTTFLTLLKVLILGTVIALGACKGKRPLDKVEDLDALSDDQIAAGAFTSDEGRALGIETVNYGYDSSMLSSSAKSTLRSNAKILKKIPGLKVQIEGHCDERGSIQYNIALGERRARAAKAYLVDQGVSSRRISTISYGKEKPLDTGSDEEAWAKNRRANFRITEK